MADFPSETSPLLHDAHHDDTGRTTTAAAAAAAETQNDVPITKPPPKGFRSSQYVTILIMIIVLLNSAGEQLMESPNTRIYESIICYRYFEKTDPSKIKLGRDVVGPGAIGGVDELLCKADKVQDELAELNGMMQLFDGFATLLLAVPFGWTADRFGRWPLIFLNLVQYALRAAWAQFVTWKWQAFDVHNIWFASTMSILGGGPAVISALLYVIVADINSEADRTTAFLRMGATTMTANLLAPPLSAWLMQKNPWIPSFIGTALMLLVIPISFYIPETLGFATMHDDAKLIASAITVTSYASSETHSSSVAKPSMTSRFLRRAHSSFAFFVQDLRLPALILPFTIHNLISNINRLLLQYISKRYHVTMSTGVLVIAIRNAATVVLLLLILPYMSACLTRTYRLSESSKDLYLARVSQVIVALGWIAIAVSPDLLSVAFSLASTAFIPCATLLMRSVIASLVPAHQIAEVYSFISVVDTLGMMAGAPLLAKLFKKGLEMGSGWIGLPFGVVGLFSGVFAGLLFLVRIHGDEERDRVEAERDE